MTYTNTELTSVIADIAKLDQAFRDDRAGFLGRRPGRKVQPWGNCGFEQAQKLLAALEAGSPDEDATEKYAKAVNAARDLVKRAG